jgi:exoribonuclease R
LIKEGHRISDSERPARVICVATRNKFAQQLSWYCRADPFCINSRIFCPLDKKFPKIFVPDSNLESIQDDDVFIVEYCEWPSSARLPIGKVVGQVAKPSSSSSVLEAGVKQIFFKCGHSIDDEKILLNTESKFDSSFVSASAELLTERQGAYTEIFNQAPVFTIDPKDCHERDDALSIVTLASGGFKVGIHIIDLGSVLRPGSAVDEYACTQATSVYTPTMFSSMLPKACKEVHKYSLNADSCPRLTVSMCVDFDRDFKLIPETVTFKSLAITVTHQLTYADAHERLGKAVDKTTKSVITRSKKGVKDSRNASDERSDNDLLNLHKIAKQLRKERRDQKQFIKIWLPDMSLRENKHGSLEIEKHSQEEDARNLVEEFMLL